MLTISQIGVQLVRACAMPNSSFRDTFCLTYLLARHAQLLRLESPPSTQQFGAPSSEADSVLREALSVWISWTQHSDSTTPYGGALSLLLYEGSMSNRKEVLSIDEKEKHHLAAIKVYRTRHTDFPNECCVALINELRDFAEFQSRNNNHEKCRGILAEAIALSDACICNQEGEGHVSISRHSGLLTSYAECLEKLSLTEEAFEAFRTAVTSERQFDSRHNSDQSNRVFILRRFGQVLREHGRDDESWDVLTECVSIDRVSYRAKMGHFTEGDDYDERVLVEDLEILAAHPHAQENGSRSCDLLGEAVQICQDAHRYHTNCGNITYLDSWTPRYTSFLRKYATALQTCGRWTEACVALGELVDFVRSECGRNTHLVQPWTGPWLRVYELMITLIEFEKVSARVGYLDKASEARSEQESLLLQYPSLAPFEQHLRVSELT